MFRLLLDRGNLWWMNYATLNAVKNSDYKALEQLHREGYPWDERTPMLASKNGNLACLVYAYNHGCPWNEHVVYEALINDHIDCLLFALKNQCPFDRSRALNIIKHKGKVLVDLIQS